MIHSDLVKCLRVFSKAEQASFVLFLQSPYFTEPKDVSKELALARYTFEVFNEQAEEAEKLLAREQVYAMLYPARTFNLQTLKNVTTSTLNFAERFIDYENLKSNIRPVGTHARLVRYFTNKAEIEVAESYLKRLERARANRNSSDLLDFFQDWEAEYAKSVVMGLQTDVRDDMNNIQTLKALDSFYWVRRLDLLLSVFSLNGWAPILETEQVDAILKETDEAMRQKPWLASPLFRLHLSAMRLLIYSGSSLDEEVFDAFLEDLSAHRDALCEHHLDRLENIAYNLCARKYSNPKYRVILFDLFQRRMTPARLQFAGPQMSNSFISLVKTGILGGYYALVLNFIEAYRHRIIGPQKSEYYYQLGLAYFHFMQNDIPTARRLVLDLPNFLDNTCKYISKMLEVKIYYEDPPGEKTLFTARLNNLRMAVVRETNMVAERKVGYDNFVRFLTRLDRLRQKANPNKVRLQELLLDIEQENHVNERIWLNQKINELLQKA